MEVYMTSFRFRTFGCFLIWNKNHRHVREHWNIIQRHQKGFAILSVTWPRKWQGQQERKRERALVPQKWGPRLHTAFLFGAQASSSETKLLISYKTYQSREPIFQLEIYVFYSKLIKYILIDDIQFDKKLVRNSLGCNDNANEHGHWKHGIRRRVRRKLPASRSGALRWGWHGVRSKPGGRGFQPQLFIALQKRGNGSLSTVLTSKS